MQKPNIEKIVFNVRGKKLELTSEEAKELKQILSDLFGETKVVHEYHSYPNYTRPWTYITWGGTYASSSTLTYTGSALSNCTSDTLCLTVN